ncbi:MAG: hypothetical protein ACLVIY_08810 [Anaerobutyricum soehngenii]
MIMIRQMSSLSCTVIKKDGQPVGTVKAKRFRYLLQLCPDCVREITRAMCDRIYRI